MHKRFLAFAVVMISPFLRAQTSIDFTLHLLSASNTITCKQSSINYLAATNYSGAVYYYWQGPVQSYTGAAVAILHPGTYSVTAFGANQQSFTKTLTISLDITKPGSSVFPFSQTITCANAANAQVTIMGTPQSLPYEHQVTAPPPYGGVFLANTASFIYNTAVPGTYTHVLINTLNGCKTTKMFTAIPMNGFPTCKVSASNGAILGCGALGTAVISINNSAGVGALSYTLLGPQLPAVPPTGSLSLTNTTYTVTLPGNYTVITRDHSQNCQASVVLSVVKPSKPSDLKIVASHPVLDCTTPQGQLLAVSANPNIAYEWHIPGSAPFSGSAIAVAINPSHPTSTLSATYTLQAFNDDTQCFLDTTIKVYQNLFPPHALISSSLQALTCFTPTLDLLNQSVTGIPANTFPNIKPVSVTAWLAPLPQSTGTGNISYAAYTSGIYTLSVRDQNNGCQDTAHFAVFDGKIYPPVNYPYGPLPFCLNAYVTAVPIYPLITGTPGPYAYQWHGPSSATLVSQNTAMVNANAIGIYTVAVTNTQNGCEATGHIIVANCITGLEDHARAPFVSVYPNPVSDGFMIDMEGLVMERVLNVYNITGALVKQIKLTGKEFIVISDLDKGMYNLQILEKNTPVYSSRIIKE